MLNFHQTLEANTIRKIEYIESHNVLMIITDRGKIVLQNLIELIRMGKININ